MATYSTKAEQYDNIFIHKVPAEAFTALEKLIGAEVKSYSNAGVEKYLSFNVGNVQITAFMKEDNENELA